MLEVDHLRKDTSIPVYAHPAAPVPVPLTLDKRLDIISECKGIGGRISSDEQLFALIRATERAYGIGIAASPEVPNTNDYPEAYDPRFSL